MVGCFCTGACKGDPSQCPAVNPAARIRSSIEEILNRDPETEKTSWFQRVADIKEYVKQSDCLHRQCSDCEGTGTKKSGECCVHFISCPCQNCTPRF